MVLLQTFQRFEGLVVHNWINEMVETVWNSWKALSTVCLIKYKFKVSTLWVIVMKSFWRLIFLWRLTNLWNFGHSPNLYLDLCKDIYSAYGWCYYCREDGPSICQMPWPNHSNTSTNGGQQWNCLEDTSSSYSLLLYPEIMWALVKYIVI